MLFVLLFFVSLCLWVFDLGVAVVLPFVVLFFFVFVLRLVFLVICFFFELFDFVLCSFGFCF